MSFLNNAGVTTLWSRIKAYLTGAHVKTTAVSGATNVDDALTSIGGTLSTQSGQIANLQSGLAYIENGDNATLKTYTPGEFIVWKGVLYTVSSNIPQGDPISGHVTTVPGGGFNMLADMYKVEVKTSTDITCTAGDYGGAGSANINIIESGYTAIGLLGINVHGTGSARITIYGYVSNNLVGLKYQNYSPVDITFNFDLYILYRKNI